VNRLSGCVGSPGPTRPVCPPP